MNITISCDENIILNKVKDLLADASIAFQVKNVQKKKGVKSIELILSIVGLSFTAFSTALSLLSFLRDKKNRSIVVKISQQKQNLHELITDEKKEKELYESSSSLEIFIDS